MYLYYPYDGEKVLAVTPDYAGQEALGVYRFFLKMPDGTYYKINSKKNRNKYIIPYLNKCEAFKKEHDGNFSPGEPQFNATIRLYNKLCD